MCHVGIGIKICLPAGLYGVAMEIHLTLGASALAACILLCLK